MNLAENSERGILKKCAIIFLVWLAVDLPFLQADDLLFFCGGRMWGSSQLTKRLRASGCQVKLVDSPNLAGLGGVSLKVFPTDPEPEARDGITPEFAQLAKYKAVMFNAIPAEYLSKLLTEERVQLLRVYVRNGGKLLLNCNAPEQLGDLLPVTFTGQLILPDLQVNRPALPAFQLLPAQWKKFTRYRPATAKEGAIVHCFMIKPGAEEEAVPGIVSQACGDGEVWFYNGDWTMQPSIVTAFCHWAYNSAFINALVSEATGMPLDISKTIPTPPKPPKQEQLQELSYEFKELQNLLQEDGTACMSGNSVQFSNGMKLKLKEGGDVEVYYPSGTLSAALNLPAIQLSGTPQPLNEDTSEAIVKKYNLKNYAIPWKHTSAEIQDNKVILKYETEDARMRWEFLPATLHLDGRTYVGYGERVVIEELPILLESLVLSSRVPRGKIRRLTCYTSPRGYLEGEIGPGAIENSSTWQFFTSGQPFTYTAVADGIMVDFMDMPIPCYAQFRAREEGDEKMSRTLRLQAGRRKAPVELPLIWHLFTPGAEQGNNDYIAVYQYARQHLRKKCGIRSFPQMTEACFYLHGRSTEEHEAAAKAAAELNFKSVWLSLCPLPLEEIAGDRLASLMALVKKYGMACHPWTAGGYGHGDNQPVFANHPQWFIRDRSGKFYRYFKKHTVADFNHPEFRDWYLSLIDRSRERGMDRIYMDMGGQIASNVNYFPPEASANLDGLIKVFQGFSERNLPFSVEGMNPLAKDQALFAPERSLPMPGREFAFVGGCPLASIDAGVTPALYLDYFRLGMYNATINVNVDGYASDVERIPGERQALLRMGQINLLLNKAHEHVPIPFVRETPFGTAWAGENTGVLFFWHAVKKLQLQLPEGWEIADNASTENIPGGTLLLIQKAQR